MRSAREGLVALHAALSQEGGVISEVLVAPPEAGFDEPGPAQLAAAGPRVAHDPGRYELLIDMIIEGSRLHYGEPLLVHPPEADLRLLLGDQLYALGLERLAALGDVEAVRELADMISAVARAHAEGHPQRAETVWHEGALAIGGSLGAS